MVPRSVFMYDSSGDRTEEEVVFSVVCITGCLMASRLEAAGATVATVTRKCENGCVKMDV